MAAALRRARRRDRDRDHPHHRATARRRRPRRLRGQGALREGDRGGAARRPGGRGRAQPQGHAGELPRALTLAAYPPREDPARRLLVARGAAGSPTCRGALVGTSSLRRRALCSARRPDLRAEPIRGNVDTRLRKLDARRLRRRCVMARAGLGGSGWSPRTPAHCRWTRFRPRWAGHPGRGRGSRGRAALLEALRGAGPRRDADAGRGGARLPPRLGAGCHTPVAGHARLDGERPRCAGLVASVDGATVLRGHE